MATTKKRIMVNVPDELEETLGFISKAKKQSLSKTVVELLEFATELQEDLYLSKLADDAIKNHDGTYLTEEEVWKELDK